MTDPQEEITTSPQTIERINVERLRRSEEAERGWRRNLAVLLVAIAGGALYAWLR